MSMRAAWSTLVVYIVICVFGIYTHAQLDRRLWRSVGYQLAKKGKEYRDR